MKLKWLGHSCFVLASVGGVKVLMDPFGEGYGYKVPSVEADVVTVSHQHRDHNNAGAAKGRCIAVDKPGHYEKGDVRIDGIATAHDDAGGSRRGANVVFKVTMDGIGVCHCGDLGHLLAPEQIKALGKVDVLLLPVGGFFTIDAAMAAKVVKQLGPTVTIPMHYKTDVVKLPIQGAEPFVKLMGGARKLETAEIEPGQNSLKEYAGVVLLDYR